MLKRAERLERHLVAMVCFAAGGILTQAQELHEVSVAGQVTTEGDQIIASGVTVSVETTEGWRMAERPADSQGRDGAARRRRYARRLRTGSGAHPVPRQQRGEGARGRRL